VIKRDIQDKIFQLAKKFPVIAVIGPRQSGKTTLVKKVFPEKEYVNLEEPDTRLFAQNDPRSFLSSKKAGLIIDEVQRVPDLFSYIQTNVDETKIPGSFILTGSHNFLMQEKISQTLAGRVAILTLLPFSLNEVRSNSSQDDFSSYIFKGFYPPIYDQKIEPSDWYPNYIRTYLERDVRLMKNIPDLNSFTLFVKLCAGRIGQLLNLSSLAVEAGISVNTVKSWLSVLEASYIVFRLEPHFQNFNKRLVKMPKLYFYDTGLACSLLGIESENQISTHYLIGSLFENLVLSDLLKHKMNNGLNSNFYYWRDKLGREVDCLIDSGLGKIILEIKSGKTINEEFFSGLKFYKGLSGNENIFSYLIYGGEKEEARSAGNVLPWHKATMVFEKRR
jgi:predicted AAA+ superfamily ATPase